jgi:hypothetical protein
MTAVVEIDNVSKTIKGTDKYLLKKDGIMMKVISYLVVLLVGTFLVTGCSIDMSTSKTDEFATKAEAMGNKFMDAEDTFESFEEKDSITAEDQELVAEVVLGLLKAIEEFKQDSSFVGKMAKKVASEKIDEKESILQEVLDKAANGTMEKADIQDLVEVLEADFDLSALRKE